MSRLLEFRWTVEVTHIRKRGIMSRRNIAALTFAAAATLAFANDPLSAGSRTAASASAPQASQSARELPFRGSLTTFETIVIAPPNLLSDGTAQGTATDLGRFTMTFTAVIDLATGAGTGTYSFTAANGDQLSATFSGQGVEIEPGVASITELATIVGGTGRFTAATGTFTVHRIIKFDEAGNASGSGSFDGHINFDKWRQR